MYGQIPSQAWREFDLVIATTNAYKSFELPLDHTKDHCNKSKSVLEVAGKKINNIK